MWVSLADARKARNVSPGPGCTTRRSMQRELLTALSKCGEEPVAAAVVVVWVAPTAEEAERRRARSRTTGREPYVELYGIR